MKDVGVVRRIDDLGRIVIPKEIRRTLRISEGDPLSFYLDDNRLVLEKYEPNHRALSKDCADFVNKNYGQIKNVNVLGIETIVTFKDGSVARVVKNHNEFFDINIAICYAFAKIGYTSYNPVCEI